MDVSTQPTKQTRKPLEGGATFGLSHRLYRMAWTVVWLLLAAWTPSFLFRWRRTLLQTFGAQLAPTARIYASARIWNPRYLVMRDFACIGPRVNCYNMAAITLGRYAIVSQGAYLCGGTHDIDSEDFELVTRPITLEDFSWVAAEAFVGPGVTIGEGAVLGARAVAFRDLPPWSVAAGNPAQVLRQRRRPAEPISRT